MKHTHARLVHGLFLLAMALGLMSLTAYTQDPPKNLLENGGFEKVVDGKFVGWLPIADAGEEARVTVVTEKPREGKNCLGLKGGNSWAAAVAERRVPIQKGKRFELRGFVRVDNGQAFIKFDYFENDSHLGQTLSEVVSFEEEWKELKVADEAELYPTATHIVATLGGLYEVEADFDAIVMTVR